MKVTDPSIEFQGQGFYVFDFLYMFLFFPLLVENFYYAFIKTGNESCSKTCYPVLSLGGSNQQQTRIDLKASSLNDHIFEKYQFDLFQWQDLNIGTIERICLQLHSENRDSKCQWPIEWLFIIHHGHSFTGDTAILK